MSAQKTILLISPYWKEPHRWMVSSYKLAELWQRLGYKVVVVCMGAETKVEQVSETLTVHSRKDIFLKDPLNFGICFGFAGYVRRLVKELKPDHIVINKILFWSSWSIIRLRLAGLKPIVITDALVGMTWWPRGFLPRLIMGIGGWTMGWLTLCLAKKIVFFHPQPPALLRKLLVAKKSQVIPTGIDPTAYHSDSDDNQIVITYVGRLESVKGADDFCAAAAPLPAEFKNTVVQVVGFYEPGHKLVAKYQDRINFTGLRDDIPEVLAKTDIFVMPSYSEGLSNAIMEAMSSSCACVVTGVGGNRFLVENGVSGFHFDPGDRAALRAHLRRLIEDRAKREQLGRAARERIEKFFSWEYIGKQYQALFEGS